jgi:hypothetical protein
MENPWWQIFLRDLRLYTPFLPYAAIYAGTIIITWFISRFIARYRYQKNITEHVGEVCEVELKERDAKIVTLSKDLERALEWNKSLKMANKAARILNQKQQEVLTNISMHDK